MTDPLLVLTIPEGIQTDVDFIAQLCNALDVCRPPVGWDKDEWLAHIKREYGLTDEQHRSHKRFHLRYIAHYFTNPEWEDKQRVRTIVVERSYLSMTFLTDYKNFYANVASQYGSHCSRIHFFSCVFTQAEFLTYLQEGIDFADQFDPVQYLGCFVVRPLHSHIVGTTLLRPYPAKTETNATRHFPTIRRYTVNLCGWKLPIDTLAFTSQDKTVGACASFAIWMAFDKTHKLFNTPSFTPSEITRLAGKSRALVNRPFPSKGLDPYQIGTVIESVGLESEMRSTDCYNEQLTYRLWVSRIKEPGSSTDHYLGRDKPRQKPFLSVLDVDLVKAYIYAYSRLGTPVFLGIRFKESSHLIVVTGYRELNAPDHELDKFKPMLDQRLLLKSRRIDRLFCHDDNIGAFSRLFFCEAWDDLELPETPATISTDSPTTAVNDEDIPIYYGTLVTSWPSSEEIQDEFNVLDRVRTNKMRRRAELEYLCVPIAGSIRLSFEDIKDKVSFVDMVFDLFAKELIKTGLDADSLPDPKQAAAVRMLNELRHMEWDIFLTEAKTYKNELLTLQASEPIYKESLPSSLLQVLPRYVWVARGRLYDGQSWKLYAELIFDSSESPVAFPCRLFTMDQRAYEVINYFLIPLRNKAGSDEPIWKLLERIQDEQLSKLMSPQLIKDRFNKPLFDAFDALPEREITR